MSLIRISKTQDVMKDSELIPTIQVKYLEAITDASVGMPYGVNASPKINTPGLLVQINGDPANSIIIPLSMFNRNKELKEGEVEVGAFDTGNYIKFDEDGNIIITLDSGKKLTMTNGGENLTNLIKQLCEACENITTMTSIGVQSVMNKGTFSSLKGKIEEFE
jgi:hypothetical protein